MKKVFIKTHGCQMNEYDSEKMLDMLSFEEKFIRTKNQDEADLLVLNTCSIISHFLAIIVIYFKEATSRKSSHNLS